MFSGCRSEVSRKIPERSEGSYRGFQNLPEFRMEKFQYFPEDPESSETPRKAAMENLWIFRNPEPCAGLSSSMNWSNLLRDQPISAHIYKDLQLSLFSITL